MSVAARFAAALEVSERALSAVTEAGAGQPARTGGWLRMEELGPLLDSSQSNHQRIALAALNGSYPGPEYAQNAWIDLHGYRDMRWQELLALWVARNRILLRVISRIPAERLDATMIIGDSPAISLRDWIDDYQQHMAHHVAQITATAQ